MAAIFLALTLFTCAPSKAVSMDDVKRSDTWLEAQLVTTYALNDSLNPFKLDVKVKDGVAQLSGTVDTPVERELAVEIAKGLKGIKQVEDNIQVEPGGTADHQKTSAASWYEEIDDLTVTAKVKTKLMWNRYVDGTDIGVDTHGGVVTLKGTVPDETTRELAGQIAQNTTGVRKVLNELTLANNERGKGESGVAKEKESGSTLEKIGQLAQEMKVKVREGVEQAGQAASDAWITAKVRTVLLFSKEAEGSDIKVSTDNGKVTLTGTVTSQAQAKRIVEITRDIQDVKEVNSALVVQKTV